MLPGRGLHIASASGTLMFVMPTLRVVPLRLAILCLLCALPMLAAERPRDPNPVAHPEGLVWKVLGDWRVNGTGRPIHVGDAVNPGTLVEPVTLGSPHSTTLLLPDGQRLLFECFTVEDCARGFRIPALVETPSPFEVDMLDRMRHVLAQQARQSAGRSSQTLLQPLSQTPSQLATGQSPGQSPMQPAAIKFPPATPARQDEAVVVLKEQGLTGQKTITIGGAFSTLENGAFTYTMRRVDANPSMSSSRPLVKDGPTCTIPVPQPGLYEIAVADAQHVARINLFVAAIQPAQEKAFASYPMAVKTLAQWNDRFAGWPAHDLLRAYLQSLFETQMDTPHPAHKRQISSP